MLDTIPSVLISVRLVAMICGVFGALSISPICIIAGVMMMFVDNCDELKLESLYFRSIFYVLVFSDLL